MKMDLSETSTDMVDLVNENELREKTNFYQRLQNALLKLHNRLEYVDRSRLKEYTINKDQDFGFLDELTVYSTDRHAKIKYKLTYDAGSGTFYVNRIPINSTTAYYILNRNADYDFCVDTLVSFENWVDKVINFLTSEYTPDLSDTPSDLISFMSLDESYKYLKELEAFVNEYKPFINVNVFDNKPLVQEGSYKLNLIENELKEIVLRCYYEIPMGDIQEYDCPLSMSKVELETLLADTKIEWGTMCYDALEALYDLVSVEKVKERSVNGEYLQRESESIWQELPTPTITINLTTSANNLSTVLQSLSSNNITLNINLTE